jgi:hypothetical protein
MNYSRCVCIKCRKYAKLGYCAGGEGGERKGFPQLGQGLVVSPLLPPVSCRITTSPPRLKELTYLNSNFHLPGSPGSVRSFALYPCSELSELIPVSGYYTIRYDFIFYGFLSRLTKRSTTARTHRKHSTNRKKFQLTNSNMAQSIYLSMAL